MFACIIIYTYTHCHYLHNLMTICRVIPRGSTFCPHVFGWQELHVCETQIVHNVCSDKCFIVTLGEVGNGEGGVGLVVDTLQVQLGRLYIPQVPAQTIWKGHCYQQRILHYIVITSNVFLQPCRLMHVIDMNAVYPTNLARVPTTYIRVIILRSE